MNHDIICRVCLKTSIDVHSFFESDSLSSDICKKFKFCTEIIVNVDDGLPHHICIECYQNLVVSYKFIKESKKSDEYLHFISKKNVNLNSTKENFINESKSPLINKYAKSKKSTSKLINSNQTTLPSIENSHFSCDNLDNHRKTEMCILENRDIKNTSNTTKDSIIKRTNQKRIITCEVCSLPLSCYSALIIHKRTHTGEKPFICSLCNRSFSQKYSLRAHIDRIHMNKKPKEKEYTCENCGKIFINSNNLKIHSRIHTGEMPYECTFCSKRFMQLSTFTSHKRRHTGEKPYACKICNKAFVELNHLKRHQSVHSEEKPFICNICNKGLKSKFALKQHSKLHTNEKEHICDQCGMSFTIKGNLDAHIRVIHSERSGQCPICYKMYSNLAEHMVKHTGEKAYQCKICDKKFAHNRGLIVHNRLHVVGNKYKCNIEGCSKSFSAQYVLECHLMKHTGQATLICSYCSKGFSRACHLTKHLKMNHLKENKQSVN